MKTPERIWTASTNGNCHVGFDTPSMNYTNEYVRADLAQAPDAGVVAELVEALRLADAALSGANMNMEVVEKKVKAALTLIAHNTTEG